MSLGLGTQGVRDRRSRRGGATTSRGPGAAGGGRSGGGADPRSVRTATSSSASSCRSPAAMSASCAAARSCVLSQPFAHAATSVSGASASDFRRLEHVLGERGLLEGEVVAQRGPGHRRPAAVPGQREHHLPQRHQAQPLGQALHHPTGQRDRRTGPLGDDGEVQRGGHQRRGGDLGGQLRRHAGLPAAAPPARRTPRPRCPAASRAGPARTAATGATNRSRHRRPASRAGSAVSSGWRSSQRVAALGQPGRLGAQLHLGRRRPPGCPAAGRRPTSGRRRRPRGRPRAPGPPGPAARRSPGPAGTARSPRRR